MKKDFSIVKLIILGLFTGIINGLFGSGGGTILVPGIFFLLGLSEHKAHATAISVILPLALVSTLVYMKHGIIVWNITLQVIIGGVFGSFIGSKLLNRIPGSILRKIFATFIIVAAIRMVF